VQEGRDAAVEAAADQAWAEKSQFQDSGQEEIQMWLDETEAQESGFVTEEPDLAPENVAAPEAAAEEERREQLAEARAPQAAAEPAQADAVPAQPEDLRIGAWVEIQIKGEWVRAQLTWSSPHATLFMFTSIGGTAHSMSRRTMDKLRQNGHLHVVADRPVMDEALDQIAQAALKNTVDGKE
jgi:hypothetical protein